MDGPHTIERCEEVTAQVLQTVFDTLYDQNIIFEGMLLKPNMVISGKECSTQGSVHKVAQATLRCLRRHVPSAVPDMVFLSGGQHDLLATAHLNAMNQFPYPKVFFAGGRRIHDPARRRGDSSFAPGSHCHSPDRHLAIVLSQEEPCEFWS